MAKYPYLFEGTYKFWRNVQEFLRDTSVIFFKRLEILWGKILLSMSPFMVIFLVLSFQRILSLSDVYLPPFQVTYTNLIFIRGCNTPHLF